MLGWRSDPEQRTPGRQLSWPLKKDHPSLLQSGWRPGVRWRVRRRAARRVEQGHARTQVRRRARRCGSLPSTGGEQLRGEQLRGEQLSSSFNVNDIGRCQPTRRKHFSLLLQARAPLALSHT